MQVPQPLVDSLVDGPSIVTSVQWHDRCESTNALAAEAAATGAAEGLLVLADEQTAGRGRHGRTWSAPPGSSLLLSLVVRPVVPAASLPLLPLLTGLVLAETVARHLPEAQVALKWPNDLLVDDRKAAGILVEGAGGAAVVGVGINVDWRGVPRPEELAASISLAEAAGADVDRWRLLAGVVGVFSRRYDQWQELPAAFLDGYRQRCATLGRDVRVTTFAAGTVEGEATEVDRAGALIVRTDSGPVAVNAGDVEHLRPA
jgi:BirA family transcriptional regulator, biotin operon repressor / biotin---[acetyl-CoA-carboxylase] ligase